LFSKSIFTGATKSEILHYLQDARLRIGGGTSLQPLLPASEAASTEELYSSEGIYLGQQRNIKHRISAVSNLSDSSNSSNDRLVQKLMPLFFTTTLQQQQQWQEVSSKAHTTVFATTQQQQQP
jgi:hypothetical protein